jgi:hypothetical protein
MRLWSRLLKPQVTIGVVQLTILVCILSGFGGNRVNFHMGQHQKLMINLKITVI